ncbi:MAG: HAD-IA family hydrolase [Acidobacteriota bacterium]|nr:HAD-IA family hydrolase [Acidobacteriota bacterium]
MNDRAVLWDLDGTLVDSGELHWRAWRDTMGAEGVTITREMFDATLGWKNDPILRAWLGDAATDEQKTRIADDKERAYRDAVAAEGLQAARGARRWIERLHAAGWRQAIASSAPRANIDAVLAAIDLGHDFTVIVAGEDVTLGKPDPQVFLLAAERLGVPPDRAVVVEDAAAGIEAATRAGMKSIGVSPKTKLEATIQVRALTDLTRELWESLLR